MRWDAVINGHQTEISEVGVDSLVARCNSCNEELGRYTQKEYPKYRLAFHEAERIVKEHSWETS